MFKDSFKLLDGGGNKEDVSVQILIVPKDHAKNRSYVKVKLIITMGKNYPKEKPKISLEEPENLSKSQIEKLMELLMNKCDELVGAEMVYALSDVATEFLQQYNVPTQSLRERMLQREAEEREAADKEDQQSESGDEELKKKIMIEQKRKQDLFEKVKNKKPETIFAFSEDESDEPEDDEEGNNSFDSEEDQEISEEAVFDKTQKSTTQNVAAKSFVGWSKGHMFHKSNLGNLYKGKLNNHQHIFIKEMHLTELNETKLRLIEVQLQKLKNVVHPFISKFVGFEWDKKSISHGIQLNIFYESLSHSLESDIKTFGGQSNELDPLRKHARQILEGIDFLHKNGITNNTINSSTIFSDHNGYLKITNYGCNSIEKELIYYNPRPSMTPHSIRETTKWRSTCVSDDLFNLGVIIIELFEGILLPQFRAPVSLDSTLPSLPKSFPPEAKEFVSACFDKDSNASNLLSFGFVEISTTIRDYIGSSPQSSLGKSPPTQLSKANILRDSALNAMASSSDSISFHNGGNGETINAPPSPLQQNQQLYSRYKEDFTEDGPIGSGGQGTVFKAKNKLDERFYAIKKVKLSSNAKSNQKVMREVVMLSRLHHQYVVRYFQAWVESTLDNEEDKVEEENEGDDNLGEEDREKSHSEEKESEEEEVESDDDDLFARSKKGSVDSEDDFSKNSVPTVSQPTINYFGEKAHFRNQMLYIQMEYCQGSTLKKVIDSGCDEDEYCSFLFSLCFFSNFDSISFFLNREALQTNTRRSCPYSLARNYPSVFF